MAIRLRSRRPSESNGYKLPSLSLTEVGTRLGVSKQRVWQIARSLQKGGRREAESFPSAADLTRRHETKDIATAVILGGGKELRLRCKA